jgi:hypothetical protein
MNEARVYCGDCRYFVRDGVCGYLRSEAGRSPNRPFAQAPFWVWSDCYSDREQVRSNVTSCCATFEPRSAQAIEARRAETGTGSVHESAVPTGDAPDTTPSIEGEA